LRVLCAKVGFPDSVPRGILPTTTDCDQRPRFPA
jgi:hypothetical protein